MKRSQLRVGGIYTSSKAKKMLRTLRFKRIELGADDREYAVCDFAGPTGEIWETRTPLKSFLSTMNDLGDDNIPVQSIYANSVR